MKFSLDHMKEEKEVLSASFTPQQIKKFRATCALIDECTEEHAALILNEILMCHSIMAFNPNHNCLRDVESVCMNGKSIQLNLQKWET
jgi:hypothetical protein